MIFFTKGSLFILAFFISSLTLALAQEEESPYNARAYFEAEQNPTYQRLLDKVQRKESLTPDDKKFINNHVDYFQDMVVQLYLDFLLQSYNQYNL